MKEETYDYIWNEIIKDNIDELYDQLSNDEKMQLNVKPLNKIKKQVYDKYMLENGRIKELYHFGTAEEKIIDIHKIAACFTKVFIEEKVFQYSLKNKVSDNVLLLNARLAYNIGLGLIRMNLIVSYLTLKKQDIVDRLLATKQLSVPLTNIGHDEYNAGRQKTLMLNDVFENEFDILTYSDMLFWIELYNRQLLEEVIKPQVLQVIDWDSSAYHS
ncbi:MAG: hypothetical protein K2H91_08845 [Lachnospiraceae bacterium]|nr:hypothetical protein [Lachnospiraceae bacterium]